MLYGGGRSGLCYGRQTVPKIAIRAIGIAEQITKWQGASK
jgi:hypothetical protein